jgi:hypothetical protein
MSDKIKWPLVSLLMSSRSSEDAVHRLNGDGFGGLRRGKLSLRYSRASWETEGVLADAFTVP